MEATVNTFATHYYRVTQAAFSDTVEWNPPLCEGDEIETLHLNMLITVKEVQGAVCCMKNSSPVLDGIYTVTLENFNYR